MFFFSQVKRSLCILEIIHNKSLKMYDRNIFGSSSEILSDLQKLTENVWETFAYSSEILRKSAENAKKKTLLVCDSMET